MRILLFLLMLFSTAVGAEPLSVFVSVLPLQTFVQKVGGEQVDVQVMVQPGDSPATYSPSPKQIQRLSRAAVFFRVGVPFEQSWMGKLSGINPRMTIVDTRQGIQLLHLEDHGHGDSELDPHVWTNPMNAIQMLHTITAALIELRPDEQAYFKNNAAVYQQQLEALDRSIRQRLANLPQKKFYVFHPAWGYYAHEYGLQQVAIEHEGKAPGARTLQRIMQQAKQDSVGVILVQPQFNMQLAQRIAADIGARVVVADPLSPDYIHNLEQVTEMIAEAGRHE